MDEDEGTSRWKRFKQSYQSRVKKRKLTVPVPPTQDVPVRTQQVMAREDMDAGNHDASEMTVPRFSLEHEPGVKVSSGDFEMASSDSSLSSYPHQSSMCTLLITPDILHTMGNIM